MKVKPVSTAVFKRVQKMTLNQFNRFITDIYTSGLADGEERLREKTIAEVSDDSLFAILLSIKGIGEKRARQAVDAIIKYGGAEDENKA